MANLPELLQQLTLHQADSLQLRPDQPPTLLVERQPRVLSGFVTAGELDALLDTLLDANAWALYAARGTADGVFDSPAGGRFAFRVRRMPEGPAVAFRVSVVEPVEPPAARATPSGNGAVGVTSGSPDVRSPEAGRSPAPENGERTAWPTSSVLALLRATWQRGASDLLLSSGFPATVRMGGDLVPLPGALFTDEGILEAIRPLLTPEREATLAQAGSLDLAVEVPAGDRVYRFRANIFRQTRGLAAAFRPVWDRIPELASLHLPPELLSLTEHPNGLILVVGPTGAGKSTTLAVLIEHLNRTQARHIITLEDPIEHVFRPQKSLVHQREVGLHVDSFSGGLRAALREAPDVILVGEMRDLDTISATLTAAETGHLVLSTMHSGSATQAVDRIIDVFPQHQQSQVRIQLSDVLRAVVTQRLLPTGDGQSRVPVLEVVRINYAFSNLIREKKTHLFASQIQTTIKDGNLPFDLSLARLVKGGFVPLEAAARAAHDPQYLKSLLGNSSLI